MRNLSNDIATQGGSGSGDLVCIDPVEGASLYDYFNGALEPDDVRRFERHLVSCAKCEAVISQLDRMMGILQEEEVFDAGQQKISDDPGSMIELGA